MAQKKLQPSKSGFTNSVRKKGCALGGNRVCERLHVRILADRAAVCVSVSVCLWVCVWARHHVQRLQVVWVHAHLIGFSVDYFPPPPKCPKWSSDVMKSAFLKDHKSNGKPREKNWNNNSLEAGRFRSMHSLHKVQSVYSHSRSNVNGEHPFFTIASLLLCQTYSNIVLICREAILILTLNYTRCSCEWATSSPNLRWKQEILPEYMTQLIYHCVISLGFGCWDHWDGWVNGRSCAL